MVMLCSAHSASVASMARRPSFFVGSNIKSTAEVPPIDFEVIGTIDVPKHPLTMAQINQQGMSALFSIYDL
jgi:hypothetical protein